MVRSIYMPPRRTARWRQKVHDCLGRALAALVIEAAHLEKFQSKAGQ